MHPPLEDPMTRTATALLAAAIAVIAATAVVSGGALAATSGPSPTVHAARYQTTWLISKDRHGDMPNGPSTHGVISGDKRYARMLAFQSEASDLVKGDGNGVSDVFLIRRAGSYSNDGEVWRPGETHLISKGLDGHDANGPSFAPAVDGNFYVAPKCVAFLSKASNLVHGDRNGKVDAFLWRRGNLKRISYPGGHEANEDVESVSVAGDCSRTAFTVGGRLFVRKDGETHTLFDNGDAAHPSFGAGEHSDLVFDNGHGDVYLSRDSIGKPHKVADGRDPAFNSLRRNVVAYEARRGDHWQIAYKDLGHDEHVVTRAGGNLGNDDSRKPVVVNSGYYVGFETDASNLPTRADRRRMDENGLADTYLYTGVRNLTLVQSVGERYGVPVSGGGRNPSVSYYSNYFVYDSSAPRGSKGNDHQVFMRYLGGK
jgi:hypothetical protein